MKKILYAVSYKLKVTRWKLQVESWKFVKLQVIKLFILDEPFNLMNFLTLWTF